jgi:hypothetical protein
MNLKSALLLIFVAGGSIIKWYILKKVHDNHRNVIVFTRI